MTARSAAEGAMLVDEGFIPWAANQLHIAGLALSRERIGAALFRGRLRLGDDDEAGELGDENSHLELAGLAGVLRNADFCLIAIGLRDTDDLRLELAG